MTEEQEKQIYSDRLITITASLIEAEGYYPKKTIDLAQDILHNILNIVEEFYDDTPWNENKPQAPLK